LTDRVTFTGIRNTDDGKRALYDQTIDGRSGARERQGLRAARDPIAHARGRRDVPGALMTMAEGGSNGLSSKSKTMR
jgi:hypothetical protein